jgi:hypothetical protein
LPPLKPMNKFTSRIVKDRNPRDEWRHNTPLISGILICSILF